MIAFQQFTNGPDKEAFHRYLADFDAVDREAELFDALYDCTDVLPNRYAELLFLPPGSTYRDAVRLLCRLGMARCAHPTSIRLTSPHPL